jgi:predicted Zn-dependent peptidase
MMNALLIPFLALSVAIAQDVESGEPADLMEAGAAAGELDEATLAPPTVLRWEVSEGTDGLLVRDTRVPLVRMIIDFPAGDYSPWFREAHAEEAFELQFYDSDGALRARADALAAQVKLLIGRRSSQLHVACLKRDTAEVLELVKDLLANTDIQAAEIKRYAKNMQIGWKASETDPDFRLNQTSIRMLHPESDARRAAVEEPAEVLREVEALIVARDALIRLPGRRIGFAGDLTLEEARAFATDLLPPVDTTERMTEPEFTLLKTDRPGQSDQLMPNLNQVYFSYIGAMPAWTDERYPAFVLATHVLGGHFFSRLYVALRHDGGDTYGARARPNAEVVEGAVVISTFTRADNVARVQDKLLAVLKTFHDEGITEEELSTAVAYYSGRLAFDRQAPGEQLAEVLRDEARGLGEGWDERVVEAMSELTVEEVNAVIAAIYDPTKFTLIRLLPE